MSCYETVLSNCDIGDCSVWSPDNMNIFSPMDVREPHALRWVRNVEKHFYRTFAISTPKVDAKIEKIGKVENAINKAFERYIKINGKSPTVDQKSLRMLYEFARIDYEDIRVSFFNDNRIKIFFIYCDKKVIIDYYYITKDSECIITIQNNSHFELIQTTLSNVAKSIIRNGR